MPGLITGVVALFTTVAGAVSAVFVAGTLASNLLLLGISVGLSYLSSLLFKPEQPKPEDVQTIIKNPTAPRQRHYGRVKTSGSLVFINSENGNLHKLIALGTGQMDAFEEVWLDDALITLGEGAYGPTSIEGTTSETGSHPTGAIGLAYGYPTETSNGWLQTAFPGEWTAAHRGDGVSQMYGIFYMSEDWQEYYTAKYPRGPEISMRVVARGSLVYSPLNDTGAWSENAANIIRDYMTHADGMRLPTSLFATTLAHAGWQAAELKCAEAVSLKAGGVEARYRLWGTYQFDERPADVLGRMLACCDGRIIPTADGGITLEIGDWAEPSVTLDEDAITGFSELGHGRDIMTTANVIAATYTSPEHDYQATDADQWRDEPDISIRGEIIEDAQFNMAPSHGQARRLMKLAAYRANPNWVGTFQCNLKALAAFGERFVRISYPLFDLNEVFEILDFRFNIGEGEMLTGVTLQVQSMPLFAYTWNAAEEEGISAVRNSTVVNRTIPVPTGVAFTYERIQVGITLVPIGIVSANIPPVGLRLEGRYRQPAWSNWLGITFNSATPDMAQTGVLEDGALYEVQLRHLSATGRPSAWSASETVTPTADPTAPGPVVDASAELVGDDILLEWTNPNSANLLGVRIYHNTVDNEGTATLIHTEYGGAGAADSWLDTDPA